MAVHVAAGIAKNSPWQEITPWIRKQSSPVTAVVSYIGADAPKLMPLKRRDVLVCEASVHAVRAGVTNPDALLTFVKRGVRVHSVNGLHAKFLVGSSTAWVGSANASRNSRDSMIEASVRIVDSTTVRELREMAKALVAKNVKLTPEIIGQLQKIKPERWGGLPTRSHLELPQDPQRVRIIGVEWGVSAEAWKVMEDETAVVATRLVVPETILNSFEWHREVRSDPVLRVGDWVIQVGSGGKPSPPERVEHLSPVRSNWSDLSHDVVWSLPAAVARRPTRKELASVLGASIGALTDLVVPRALVVDVISLYSQRRQA